MRAWYDIYNLNNLNQEDVDGIEDSRCAIDHLIQHEHAQGIPMHKIILAGFSQGGAMALHTGLTYPHRLAGIIALSCYLPRKESFTQQRNAANYATPIFQAHGDVDPILPIRAGQLCYKLLQELNYTISWHHYPIPHSVSPQEIQDISLWMQQQLKIK